MTFSHWCKAAIQRGVLMYAAFVFFCLLMALPAWAGAAPERLKLAVGQRGNWDTSVAEVGYRAGIFRKHGLELEILYTDGGGETLQAVISRGVDVGVEIGRASCRERV